MTIFFFTLQQLSTEIISKGLLQFSGENWALLQTAPTLRAAYFSKGAVVGHPVLAGAQG